MVIASTCWLFVLVAGSSESPEAPVGQRVEGGAPDLPALAPRGLRPATTTASRTVGSYNWSGYAQSSTKKRAFTGVVTTFVVTTVDTTPPGDQYSSDWVGIDGLGSARLVQAGVEEDNVGGTAVYRAWTEVLPAPENPLSLVIHPGDTVTASVREIATNKWTLTVADVTTSRTARRIVTYRAPGKSVEAIHERPCLALPCSTNLASLAKTSNEVFDLGQFTSSAPGSTAIYSPLLTPVSGAQLDGITMVAASGAPIATPSGADTDQDGFALTDGGVAPAPPSGT